MDKQVKPLVDSGERSRATCAWARSNQSWLSAGLFSVPFDPAVRYELFHRARRARGTAAPPPLSSAAC
ncbi:hypothetical protein AB0P44_44565 [Streptomyces chartreusis]|uniref:hypothetical protein n=1 Tax=Streptomyces chartreusis TaxID=1969 RepID=UPI0034305B91